MPTWPKLSNEWDYVMTRRLTYYKDGTHIFQAVHMSTWPKLSNEWDYVMIRERFKQSIHQDLDQA